MREQVPIMKKIRIDWLPKGRSLVVSSLALLVTGMLAGTVVSRWRQSRGSIRRSHTFLRMLPPLCAAALFLGGCQSEPPKLGEPLEGLSPEQSAQFRAGKSVFVREFEPK